MRIRTTTIKFNHTIQLKKKKKFKLKFRFDYWCQPYTPHHHRRPESRGRIWSVCGTGVERDVFAENRGAVQEKGGIFISFANDKLIFLYNRKV
jgi:hypothetical protein